MPILSNCTLKVGAAAVAAAYFRGQNLIGRPWINADADTTIQVISDSLGDATTELIYKAVLWIASQHPDKTVKYSLWNNSTLVYPALTTLQTGTGPHTITVYNFAVGNTQPHEPFGAKKALGIDAVDADLVLWQHGKNIRADTIKDGKMQQAWEMYRLAHPGVPHVVILEPPNRDDTAMDGVISMIHAEAARYGDIRIIDTYTPWITAGKPAGWYVDNLHPNETGVDAGSLPAFQAEWNATPLPASIAPAFLTGTATNLLVNGDFSDWTGSLPAGWSGVSSPTATKEATIVDADYERVQSLKLTGTLATANIRQDLAGAALDAAKGQHLTVAIRAYIPSGMPTSVGRCSIVTTDGAGTRTYLSSAEPCARGGWVWMILRTQAPVGADATVVRVILNCDISANSVSEVYYDRAIMIAGNVPRDMVF